MQINLLANDLDTPIAAPTSINFEKTDFTTSEPVLRKSKRGVLEAILRLQKRIKNHNYDRYYFWKFTDYTYIGPTSFAQRTKTWWSMGQVPAVVTHYHSNNTLTPFFTAGYTKYINLLPFPYVNSDHKESCFVRISVLQQKMGHERHANLQFIDGNGCWNFFPVLILSEKIRPTKNNRRPLFGEVITAATTETVYTFLLPLEVLYEPHRLSGNLERHINYVNELLQSFVIYKCEGDKSHGVLWQRIAITTTDSVLHSDKPRAYITLEAVVVKEILDS